MHGSRQSDGGGIVGEGPDNMQVAGCRIQEVQPQVTEGHDSVAEQPQSLPGQDQGALVLLSLLWQRSHSMTRLNNLKRESFGKAHITNSEIIGLLMILQK